MNDRRILKIYISNFLTGLVFWYGVEKLFMQSIGIDAVGVGIASAFITVFNLVFDIPSGILADRWSRKGMLLVSALSLAACALILGASTGLLMYILGYAFYGLNIVANSGTYQAITYDILYEQNKADQYSKIMGRAYGLFLVGAGVANICSGFLANQLGFRWLFILTVIPCVVNFLVILSLKEPVFHKLEQKEKALKQLGDVTKTIMQMKVLRGLTIVLSIFMVVEVFKQDFGQLYMLRYITQPEYIGLLWAAYAFTWGLGSIIAHRFKARLNLLIGLSVAPLLVMSFVDDLFSIVLFMVQATASAAMINQIETRIQDATPSSVRASVLSVLSSAGRIVATPALIFIGWIIREYDAYWALRFVTLLATAVFIYWLISLRKIKKLNVPIVAEPI